MKASKHSSGSSTTSSTSDYRLPALLEEVALDEMAQSMEEALRPPSSAELEGRRMRRYDKAGTYTLAEKYRLTIEGFKKR